MTVAIYMEGKHPMSLKSKILLILLVVVALYAALDYGIQRLVVFPSFIALEQHEAKKDLERAFEALRREFYHLDTFNHDWAAWDDTYQFVRDRNTDYISSNLVAQTFIDNKLNLIYVCNEVGKVIWGEIRSVDTWQRMHLKKFPAESLPPTHPLLSHDNVDSAIAGVPLRSTNRCWFRRGPLSPRTTKDQSAGLFLWGDF